jgi:hypothetical protein
MELELECECGRRCGGRGTADRFLNFGDEQRIRAHVLTIQHHISCVFLLSSSSTLANHTGAVRDPAEWRQTRRAASLAISLTS